MIRHHLISRSVARQCGAARPLEPSGATGTGHCLLLFAAVVGLALCGASAVFAQDVYGGFEGDVELLNVLRDAQLTNAARFPKGECVAVATIVDDRARNSRKRRPEQGASVTRYDLIWEGKQRWYSVSSQSAGPNGALGPPARSLTLHTPTKRLTRTIASNGDQSLSIRSAYRPDEFFNPWAIAPDQLWYWGGLVYRPAADCFDPNRFFQGATRRTLSTTGNHLVRLEHEFASGKRWCLVDMNQGANIVEYGSSTTDGDLRYAKYHWTNEGSGGLWWLRRYEEEIRSGAHPDPWWRAQLEISSFDPSPDIRSELFSEENFRSGRLRRIIDMRGSTPKVTRVGDVQLTEELLKALSEQARKEGFAAPKQ